MKWIALKSYLLPFIEQEADKVVDKYLNLINEMRRTNKLEIINEFDELVTSIAMRINEIENFYVNNINDIRAKSFIKVQMRLKNLLNSELNDLQKFENNSEMLKYNSSSYPKVDDNSGQMMPSLNTMQKNFQTHHNTMSNLSEKNKFNTAKNLNHSRDYSPNSTSNKKYSLTNKKGIDSSLTATPTKPNININNKLSGQKSTKDKNDWKEIVFKIKLSETEYKHLLKEKAKAVKI